jgi:hypothetical protein
LRIALKKSEQVTAIVSQNRDAYEEGLRPGWTSLKEYWQNSAKEGRDALRSAFTPGTTRYQYLHGVDDPSLASPDGPPPDNFY